MPPLKVYLCDLTHDTIVPVSDTIPINIGFVGSYAKKVFGGDIEISLFKYPQTAIDAIRETPPDALGLSNYSWNSHLSERLAQFAKEVNPGVFVTQGGTNFPHDPGQQIEFLLNRPATDCYIEWEGEISFANFVSRVLKTRDGKSSFFDNPIDGCMFIDPSTRNSHSPVMVKGNTPPRIKNLDAIPSPYLTGMMDKFFDGRLTPFMETNRGCPFKCSFCHTGNDYFRKTNMFSTERVLEEIKYIAKLVTGSSITNLHIADTNFAMYPRDREICQGFVKSKEETGWPLHIMGTTGKNNKQRVIDITEALGTSFSVTMSVQSLDDTVLSNIRRSNIRLDDYRKINTFLKESGRTSLCEIILGLPGETKESFLKGIAEIIDSGVTSTVIYTLMILYGTEFMNPDYRQKHGIKSKFRIVPLNFGEYAGERVFDYEEVGIETNTMPFENYLNLRGFSLIVETLYSGRPFDELARFALSLGIKRSDLLIRAHSEIDNAPPGVQKVMKEFLHETEFELWDSEDELIQHYKIDENYQRLVNGEVGGNLIYKYKSKGLSFAAGAWIKFLASVCKQLATENLGNSKALKEAEEQIGILSRYCGNKLSGIMDKKNGNRVLSMNSPFDILGWLEEPEGVPLSDFTLAEPISYEFFFTESQIKSREDLFNRFGTDPNGLSKIITRISSLGSLFRNVRSNHQPPHAAVQDMTGGRKDESSLLN